MANDLVFVHIVTIGYVAVELKHAVDENRYIKPGNQSTFHLQT